MHSLFIVISIKKGKNLPQIEEVSKKEKVWNIQALLFAVCVSVVGLILFIIVFIIYRNTGLGFWIIYENVNLISWFIICALPLICSGAVILIKRLVPPKRIKALQND